MSDQTRDPVTGQYAYEGDWERLCRCGHTLGIHVSGGFDCLNGSVTVGGDGTPCDCERQVGVVDKLLVTGEEGERPKASPLPASAPQWRKDMAQALPGARARARGASEGRK